MYCSNFQICRHCGKRNHIATRDCSCGALLIEARAYKVSATDKPRKVGREKHKIQQKVKNPPLFNSVLYYVSSLFFLSVPCI